MKLHKQNYKVVNTQSSKLPFLFFLSDFVFFF